MYRIALIGEKGKMGQLAKEVIADLKQFSLVCCLNRNDPLEALLKQHKPDIALDLSSSESVLENSWTIVKQGIRPLIGASGLNQKNLEELKEFCAHKNLGGLCIPNFSIAFALINKVTKEFAKYYDDFSIVEFHHKQKKDAPSGTAKHTAKILNLNENHIASVRAQGFLAKQQLYIQSEHERILIDHESFDRKSFAKGIILSLEKVVTLNKFHLGLESILD